MAIINKIGEFKILTTIKNKVLFRLLLISNALKRNPKSLKNAGIIEHTLASFGIKSRVVRIDFEKESNLFCLKIPYGVRVEEIEKLSKTIALGVASKTGRVEIIAPIPGESCVGVRVPK